MFQRPKFLLISDNTSYELTGPRYLGPYRIAHELEKAGIQTIVLDYFYSFPNFFEFLEKTLDQNFIGIGFSTTFLTPPASRAQVERFASRPDKMKFYHQSGIVDADYDTAAKWFTHFRQMVQKKAPLAKVFLGGAKTHLFLKEPLNSMPGIDYLVMGVTDKVFPQVLADLAKGLTPKFEMIGQKKVIDTMKTYIQPKSCPRHDWLDHWNVQPGEALPIEISRGCAFNCKFCNYDKTESLRKSADDLKQELIMNYEKFGTQFYHFVDDCFNDSRKKVDEVCNLLLSLPFKIEWVTYARFDVAVKFPETADLMVAAGGRGFHWGVESLTPEVARRAGKGTPPEKIKEFISDFYRKHGHVCYSTGSLIAGLPGETRETWQQQIDWLMNTDNFHFVQIGPLGLRFYKAEFDGKVVDYADYSRHPEKYGFRKISYDPEYWQHDTMDFTEAAALARDAMKQWQKKMGEKNGLTTDIWVYPQLRSLGFSEQEVRDCFFSSDPLIREHLKDKGRPVLHGRIQEYFSQMHKLSFSE